MHFEQREHPVYDLAERSFRLTSTGVEIHHETMQEFVMFLYCLNCARQTADRPVFDKTIFTALEEQLGLKLQPRKGPVDLIRLKDPSRTQR